MHSQGWGMMNSLKRLSPTRNGGRRGLRHSAGNPQVARGGEGDLIKKTDKCKRCRGGGVIKGALNHFLKYTYNARLELPKIEGLQLGNPKS